MALDKDLLNFNDKEVVFLESIETEIITVDYLTNDIEPQLNGK